MTALTPALDSRTFWMRWLMMGAMAITGIAPTILGRFFCAEIFIRPNAQMPDILEATRQMYAAMLPLDWRLQQS